MKPTLAPPTESAAPLTLDNAIDMACARNPDIRIVAERVAEADARVGEATSAFFPHISTRLAFARTDNPAEAFGMIIARRSLTFTARIGA